MAESDSVEDDDDWADEMLSKALQLNAYAEHRVTTVATSQFAGNSSRVTKAFASAGGLVMVDQLGITPAERRAAIRKDPEPFLRLVEQGYGEKAIFLLLGFGRRAHFLQWLSYIGLMERYEEAVRDSAYEYEARAEEALDQCAALSDKMAELRENITDENAYVIQIAGALLGKEHDMRYKIAKDRTAIAMAKAARLNNGAFGASRAHASGGAQERRVDININLGSGVQGLSVDTTRVIDSTVDTSTTTVVSSLGINLSNTENKT